VLCTGGSCLISRGRDQEVLSSKPAWANTLQDPVLKKKSQKRAGGVAQGVVLEFKLQYHKNKNTGFPVSLGLHFLMKAHVSYKT
jgi:hypothetical protein